MAYVKGQPFKPQFTDPATNTLMSNGTVEFYLTGTSTPTPYYTDSSGTEGGTSLTLDSGGKPSTDVFYDTAITYKLVVKNAAGGIIETLDPYSVKLDASLLENYSSTVASVTAVREASLSGQVSVKTLGYAAAGDGGGAVYYADTDDTTTADDGYQCIVSSDGVRFKLGATNYFNVRQAGALGSGDDATAIQQVIAAAKAAYDAGERFIALDFGHDSYSISEQITISGMTDLHILGSFSLALTSTQNIGLNISSCPRVRNSGRMQIIGNVSSTAYATRNNYIGLQVDDCTGASFDHLDIRHFKADGLRITGTTSQPAIAKLDISYCGTGNSASTRLDDVSWAHVSETGGVNNANQRSVIELSSLPSDITTYMDTAFSATDNYNPVYLLIDSELYKIESYSGTQVTIWPWVDPAKAGGTLARFVFGCAIYSDGNDTSVAQFGSVDISACGIAYLGASLYPAAISSFVTQANTIGVLIGESTSGAAEELSILRGYFETNVFDIVQASQAATGISIESTTALHFDKCYRMYSKSSSYVRQHEDLEEISIQQNGYTYINRRDENRIQSTVSVEITKPDPFYLTTSGQTVLIACDEDIQRLTKKKTQLVYVYSEANGMAAGGTITFTPPSGCTLNGLAADASQEFNTAVGPQVFLIARADATTFFVEPVGQSTVTKV